ncbi:protein TIFY 4B [Sesamum angolense]|uniref:Protein TIFY 4B n=1 Tax=Sesamum angolense TaxID=2727404 RepID=A0AAE1X8I6_9LAMI|nr:protein TIFY 4B [Sesamum angolense]
MPESYSMPPEETAVKSPRSTNSQKMTLLSSLAKTAAVTSRRKAIQQVIMLKTLLETPPDSDAGSRKRLHILRPHNSRSSNNALENVPRGTSGDAENSVSAEETTPYDTKDLDKPDSSGGFSGRFAAAKDESAQPRTTGLKYSSWANDNILLWQNKCAQAIMHIAASPLQYPEELLVDGSKTLQPFPCLSKAVSAKAPPAILPTHQTVKTNDNSLLLGEKTFREETHLEGPSTRKASVQRYLEKRKDRFKSKRKAGMTPCASLDMYFNHQMGNQMPRNDTCSPPQIRPPSTPARCSSMDNDSVKNVCLSTGLQ